MLFSHSVHSAWMNHKSGVHVETICRVFITLFTHYSCVFLLLSAWLLFVALDLIPTLNYGKTMRDLSAHGKIKGN